MTWIMSPVLTTLKTDDINRLNNAYGRCSYAANGQEDHKTWTNLNDDTIITVNDCYFDSIVQCPGVVRNVQVYCAIVKVKIDPHKRNFDSIAQCLNVLRNVRVYFAMSEVKVDPYKGPNPDCDLVFNGWAVECWLFWGWLFRTEFSYAEEQEPKIRQT